MNEEKKQYKSGKDICVSVFLIVTMILRLLTENTELLTIFAVVGFIVAIYDIYTEVEKNYNYYGKRFFIVRGGFIVAGICCAIAVASMIILKIEVDTLVLDELSILSLLASLPKDLHCHLIGSYIRGRKEKL